MRADTDKESYLCLVPFALMRNEDFGEYAEPTGTNFGSAQCLDCHRCLTQGSPALAPLDLLDLVNCHLKKYLCSYHYGMIQRLAMAYILGNRSRSTLMVVE